MGVEGKSIESLGGKDDKSKGRSLFPLSFSPNDDLLLLSSFQNNGVLEVSFYLGSTHQKHQATASHLEAKHLNAAFRRIGPPSYLDGLLSWLARALKFRHTQPVLSSTSTITLSSREHPSSFSLLPSFV